MRVGDVVNEFSRRCGIVQISVVTLFGIHEQQVAMHRLPNTEHLQRGLCFIVPNGRIGKYPNKTIFTLPPMTIQSVLNAFSEGALTTSAGNIFREFKILLLYYCCMISFIDLSFFNLEMWRSSEWCIWFDVVSIYCVYSSHVFISLSHATSSSSIVEAG